MSIILNYSLKLEDEKQENLEWLEREINEVKKFV